MPSSKPLATSTKPPSHASHGGKIEADLASALTKLNAIMRNQFIIDIMILTQATTFLLHPERAHQAIIRSFAMTISFASASMLLGYILSHTFNRRNLGSICTVFISLAFSIALYFLAGFFAPALHYIIAVLVILLGMTRIWGAYHFAEVRRLGRSFGARLTSFTARNTSLAGLSRAARQNATVEATRVLSPAILLSGKMARFHYGQLLISLALIVTGIAMLFFRLGTDAILLRIAGIILVFGVVADLAALLWTHRESSLTAKITHYPKT